MRNKLPESEYPGSNLCRTATAVCGQEACLTRESLADAMPLLQGLHGGRLALRLTKIFGWGAWRLGVRRSVAMVAALSLKWL